MQILASRSSTGLESSNSARTYLQPAPPPANGMEHDGWTITLCDLTLLLLGFAVLWYVTATRQRPELRTEIDYPAPVKVAPSPTNPRLTVVVRPVVVEPIRSPETDGAVWEKLAKELSEAVAGAGLGKDAIVESKPGEILLSLRDNVPFDSGKAELRPQAKTILEKIVVTVLAHPQLSVAISGHTDNRRIANARYPSNWELSTARAIRVGRHLVERGLHPSRIAVQGFADHRPLKPNSTPANRKTNRRVEIRLIYDTASPSSDIPQAEPK